MEFRFWCISHDGEPEAFRAARRHYSAWKNRKPKIRQFVGPGQNLVLIGLLCQALFAWRKFIDDSGQVGVCCTIFRNESPHRASDMILEAEWYAWDRWPGERLYTMIDPKKIRPTRTPGRCFLKAGWRRCGKTKKGLIVLEKLAGWRV